MSGEGKEIKTDEGIEGIKRRVAELSKKARNSLMFAVFGISAGEFMLVSSVVGQVLKYIDIAMIKTVEVLEPTIKFLPQDPNWSPFLLAGMGTVSLGVGVYNAIESIHAKSESAALDAALATHLLAAAE